MREKLIKLLYHAPCESELEGKPGSCQYRKHGQCGEVERLDYCAVEHLADHLVANGVTIQKWIPVTERLPENMDDRVLVLLPTISYNYPIGNQRIDTDRYRGEYRKWVRYGDKVTHWMPLPEPPKGVE